MATYLGVTVLEGFKDNPHAILPALLLAPPILYVADVVSQVFHKWLDSYASEKSRVWGTAAREFRKHHEDPNNLNHVGNLDHVSAFGKLLAPGFAAAAISNSQLSPEVGASIWLFMMSMLHGTEFHKQAHIKNPNWFYRFLQKARLTLGREEHLAHHKPPFDENYAVLNGWSNGLARRTKLWHRLDMIFWKLKGRMPHNWIQDPRSIPEQVVRQLEDDLTKIPPELWATGETYPGRVPARLKPQMELAREKWQKDFIGKRRAIYLERAEEDTEGAEKDWEKEQKEFPYIYGAQVTPLFGRE
jgi:hypothetical protein